MYMCLFFIIHPRIHFVHACVSPTQVRELQVSPDAVLRNNIVIVLYSICQKFTSVVDPHMDALSACLKDESPLVRKHTLLVLRYSTWECVCVCVCSLPFHLCHCIIGMTHCTYTIPHIHTPTHSTLLQQDFLKWKGTLFLRYLAMCVDEHPEVASLARSSLHNIVVAKAHTKLYRYDQMTHLVLVHSIRTLKC
jgi:condensin-2 complex subunit D3